jgi:hypothetical protein
VHSQTTNRPIQSINKVWFFCFMLAAFVFLYLRTFLLPATPLSAFGDEIHYLLHAVRMMHGQLPFRDYFTFILPGTDLLYTAMFRLFGIHMWVVQIIVIALGLLLSGAITWIASSVLRGPLAILPGLLFLVYDFDNALDATHHWWSTLFVMAAAGVLLRGKNSRRLFTAGALCGIAAVFTQTQGLMGLLAIAGYVIWIDRDNRRESYVVRDLFTLSLPFFVIVCGVVGYYAYKIGLSTILFWTIYFPVVYFPTLPVHTYQAYLADTPHLHKLSDLLAIAPYLFIHLIVPFIYLLCITRLMRKKKSMEPETWRGILLLSLVGLGLSATVISAATYLRLCVVAPPAIVICVWYFSGAAKWEHWVRRAMWTVGVVMIVYLPVSRQLHTQYYLDLPTGRTGFVNVQHYEKMHWFAERTRPGETFFNEPLIAFALSLSSPTSIDNVMQGQFTRPEQVDELLSSLTAHKTQYIFLYSDLYKNPHGSDNLEPLRHYMVENYRLVKDDTAGQVWERN